MLFFKKKSLEEQKKDRNLFFKKRVERWEKVFSKDQSFLSKLKKDYKKLIIFLDKNKLFDIDFSRLTKKIEKKFLDDIKKYEVSENDFQILKRCLQDCDSECERNKELQQVFEGKIKEFCNYKVTLFYLIEHRTLFEQAKEFGISLVIALIIVIPFRYFIAEPYIVSGSSMSPNFETGDYILVNKFAGTKLDPVQRGDVLVFVPPHERKNSWRNIFPIIDTRVKYIKRVVGLPGEEVKIEHHKVWIKKNDWKEFKILDEPYLKNTNLRLDNTIFLKKDEYFMLGDNRGNSYDSEEWGPIKKTDIIGEPFLRLFPFQKFGIEPSNYKFKF